jgi:hypothetical protein
MGWGKGVKWVMLMDHVSDDSAKMAGVFGAHYPLAVPILNMNL